MSATQIDFPQGTYISVANAVRLNKGGRTAAMLMRARMISEYGGARSLVATFADLPEIDHTRTELRRRGALGENVELVNVFEDYVARDPERFGRGDRPLAKISDLESTTTQTPDGHPHRTTYIAAESDRPVVSDFLRPDGSVAIRMEHGRQTRVTTVDHHGRIVQTYRSRSQFLQHWLRELVPEGDAFIVTDSRFAILPLYGLKERRMHVLGVFHNPHIVRRGPWDGEPIPSFGAILDRLPDIDGLVLLTERQREEVALRLGDVDNLFAVGNPVTPPELPDPLPARDPKQLVIVARLEGQKRLAHALKAFADAYSQDDELRLDIYGDGTLRTKLEHRAAELGVGDAVTFHGYDPAARQAIQTASAFLMTSLYEGYPLATLEAMSHGCPVISYDIRFGPREQITDGVDGFLVEEEGDIKTFTARILQLTSNAELATRMSAAAYEKAAAHSPRHFAEDWAQVFRTVKAHDGDTRRIHDGKLLRSELRGDRFLARAKLSTSGGSFPSDGAKTRLDVIGTRDSEVVSYPVTVRSSKRWPRLAELRMAARLDPAKIAEQLGDQPVRLRLRTAWGKASWQADVGEGEVRRNRLVLAARAGADR